MLVQSGSCTREHAPNTGRLACAAGIPYGSGITEPVRIPILLSSPFGPLALPGVALSTRKATAPTHPNLWPTTRCHHTGQEKFALDTAFVLIDAITLTIPVLPVALITTIRNPEQDLDVPDNPPTVGTNVGTLSVNYGSSRAPMFPLVSVLP